MLELIKKIMNDKNTKVCLAADLDNMSSVFSLIEEVGDKICILKLHYDIIHDFFNDGNIRKLKQYKQKYNFLVWEDSKFADIGYIMQKKITTHISSWADLISVHPIGGIKSVTCLNNIDIGIILIGEMSTEGHLFNNDYQTNIIKISHNCKNVVGIVCQHKMTDTLLNITPGISVSHKQDALGQQYTNPIDNDFSDIFVVGRSIYQSDTPRKVIDELNH